jgi:hypothetical protein
MRLRNLTDHPIEVPLSTYTHPNGGCIRLIYPFYPGAWSEELDPSDPLVRQLMESGLKPVHIPTWFEKLLREPPF